MVSSFSNPGFPPVHTRQTAAIRFSSLDDRVASLEATMASLPSLIDAAIEKAFATKLPSYFDKFRRALHSRSAGEGIYAPLAIDHHISPAIEPIQLPRSPICAGGAQSQLIPVAIQAPPLLSSSPLLRALATSTVKPQSNDSAAATVSLLESKRVIHALTMPTALRLLRMHSFSDTTKTEPEVVLNSSFISANSDAKLPSLLTANYSAYLKDKFGWVNWYLVGKFVKKDLCASTLFDEMSKRGSDENIGTLFNFIYYLLHYLQRLISCHITSILNSVCANQWTIYEPSLYSYVASQSLRSNLDALVYLKLLIYAYLALNLSRSCNNNSIMNTLNGAVLEYRCESCPRVQIIPDQWVASVQLRQHVSHRCWFSYMEQLILKHGFAASAIWIKQMVNKVSYEEKANVSHVEFNIIGSQGLDEKSSLVDIVMFQLAESVVGINQTTHSVGLDDIESDAQVDLSEDPRSKVPIEENLVKVPINLGYDAGLFYLGNTCYMNSIIQFLHFVPVLKSALIKYSQSEGNDEGDQTSHRLIIATCALISELDKGIKAMAHVQFWMVLLNKYPQSIKALFGIELVSRMHYIESGEKGSESVQSFEGHISHEVKHLQCLHSCEFFLESIIACTLSKLVLRIGLYHVEFDHVAEEIQNVGVRWISLPTASILLFLFHGMYFKECGKSGTKPYVTKTEQQCVSHHSFSHMIGKKAILLGDMAHISVLVTASVISFGCCWCYFFAYSSGMMSLHNCLIVSVSWQKELFKFLELDTTQPPYVFKCQLYTLTEVMKDMVEALGLLQSFKSSMHTIGVANDGLTFGYFNDSKKIAGFNIQYRLLPSISLFQKMEFYDNQILGGPSITERSYKRCFLEGKMYESYTFINKANEKDEFDHRHSWKNILELAPSSFQRHFAKFGRTEKDIIPMGGFPHCGVVKDGYIWRNEWCVGPKKKTVNLCESLLNQTAHLALEDIKLRTISKVIIPGKGPTVIVAALVEILLAGSLGVGPFSPIDAAAYFLATSMEIEMISWVENYKEATSTKSSLTKLWEAAIISSGVLSGSTPNVESYLQIVFVVPAASFLLQDSLVSARSNKFFNFQP